MTQKRYTEIPKRQKCINKEEPYIGGAKDIIDDELNKPQSQVNQEEIANLAAEVQRAQQAEGVLDGKVATEKQRAEGVEGGLNTRLQTVEQLAEISVGGGDIGIGTAADFESDDPEDLAKVPTISAMLGGTNDGVYDISARHSGATYADLAAALGTNGANVPVGVRKGGMSVKFVQTDNKYIQARLMAQNFTTDIGQWQIEDDQVCGMGKLNTGSPNYDPLISDANDAEVNKIYSINKANYVANMPSDGQGVLLTMSYSKNATVCICQIFISAVTFELYWRVKWGSNWNNWKGTNIPIEKLSEGYIYKGIATPSTNPGTPIGKVFYLAAPAGEYTNFGGLVLPQGINILKFNGSTWQHELLYGVDDNPTEGNNNLVRSSGVAAAIKDLIKGIGNLNTGSPDYNPLITDANDAEVNRIYAISKANYVANLPSDGQGVLATLSYSKSATDVKLQLFVSAITFELYWRIKFGNSTYYAWNESKTKYFEDAINNLQNNTIPCTNGTLLDQENWINNHYLNGNNTQGESSEFAISNYIPCTKGQTIYFTNAGNNLVLFYDENNNYISGYNTDTNAGYVIVPNVDSIAYLRFNVVKANIENGLFVSYNENDHIWNIPYGEKKYTINDIVGMNIKVTEDVTIGIEYNTLKSALDYADSVANENHIVNILVPTGEYNVFSDIDLYSQDSSFKGLIVPDYVNIIGIGAAKDVILKAELPVDMTGYAFTRGNVSTLNLWRNNNLKNLTVIGSNMRYAIHNDTATGTYTEDTKEVFENCTFIGRQTDVAVNVDSSFGSGMKNGAYLKFKNCKFIIESVATESSGVTFATNFHNTANSFKTITWDFENCLFSSGYKNFAMHVSNYSGVKNGVIILNGCKIDKRICAESQTGSRNSDYIYYGTGSVFTDGQGRFYTNGVDLVNEDTEMLL